ncbi:unnamed protein product [Ceratitis capitata]|uniref:(Mediterranean fruit fly) hypothetical protein n=1 Tax=Ceratitis capitata TaxID=7213 RepID=A0A811VBF9_CERCA|nr:unnamed protein product [Ceratitis capitata]
MAVAQQGIKKAQQQQVPAVGRRICSAAWLTMTMIMTTSRAGGNRSQRSVQRTSLIAYYTLHSGYELSPIPLQ